VGEVVGNRFLVVGEGARGQPDRALAGARQDAVAAAIALEASPRAVGGKAVELDDQARLGPVEVGAVARDPLSDARPRQAVTLHQGEEAVLQGALGQLEWADHSSHDPRASATWIAFNGSDKGGGVQESQVFRLVYRSPERLVAQDVREVQERAGEGGRGDALVDGDICRRQSPGSVKTNAALPAATGAGRHDHVDNRRGARPDAEVRRRGDVRQRRPLPAGQHRRHVVRPGRQDGVPDRGDATVDAMESPGAYPPPDSGLTRRNCARVTIPYCRFATAATAASTGGWSLSGFI
jgi:hypothetical protein